MSDVTAGSIDGPLFEHTDAAAARPLPTALGRARVDIVAAANTLAALPEPLLTKPWVWKPGGEEEVRYGGYRAAEALELAEVDARVAAPWDATEREAARLIGHATAARWDLHGVVVPLGPGVVDADPGGGEWSVRRTLGHIIGTQRGFAWSTAWWQTQGLSASDPDIPQRPPEAIRGRLPDEATTEAAGSMDDLLRRLDAILDLGAERLAGLPDERLAFGARWAGFPVTVSFRILRWASHLREHTIQVEKTLVMLGHVPNEPARLVRNMLAAYGRAESVVFGRQASAGIDAAAERIASAAAEARAAVEAANRAART